jgi:hypothetical protein
VAVFSVDNVDNEVACRAVMPGAAICITAAAAVRLPFQRSPVWFAAWWQAYAVVIWPRVDSQFDGAVDVLHSASF